MSVCLSTKGLWTKNVQNVWSFAAKVCAESQVSIVLTPNCCFYPAGVVVYHQTKTDCGETYFLQIEDGLQKKSYFSKIRQVLIKFVISKPIP